MSFTRISRDESTRTEVYSDGILDVTIVHPQHHTSGFPCDLTISERAEPYSPAEDNAKTEGEDVPSFSHKEYKPKFVMGHHIDAPPATSEEFEKL